MNRRHLTFITVFCLLIPLTASGQKPYRGEEYRTISTFTYGRFEVRMKSAQVSGTLGTLFTYYDPASPWNEIDIEAMGRYNNETQFNTIVPTQNDNHVRRQTLKFNPHAAFHVYAIEWAPDYVAWRVDGFEVYRQTGSHIAQLRMPQKLMMNIWQPAAVDWAGSFDPAQLPVFVYYDWVKYYAYTPGVDGDFTLQWTDNFDAFDSGRWQKATHTWDGNNAQFVQQNAVFQDGYLILCLTSNTTSGYSGAAIVDKDVDPPYPVSAWLYDSTLVVTFSEPVDPTSAEDPTHYAGGVLTYKSGHLRSDQQTVDLSVGGTMPTAPFPLIIQSVKDRATPSNVMTLKFITAVTPVEFPLRINVGGLSSGSFLGDSVWSAAQRYGAVGGIPATIAQATPVGGTPDPEIYRTSLHGISSYHVRLPNGTYNVTLMMVEDRFVSAGKRLFSASVEGQPLFSNLDIYQTVGANYAHTALATNVQVLDNMLDIAFAATIDSSTLSGIKIESLGGSTGVNEGGREQPSLGFSVYPNPFNASAVLRYELPSSQPVSIAIHDIIGRRIASIDLGVVAPGSHEYRWGAAGLPSGVYLCTLHGGSAGNLTRRVLLVR